MIAAGCRVCLVALLVLRRRALARLERVGKADPRLGDLVPRQVEELHLGVLLESRGERAAALGAEAVALDAQACQGDIL